MGKIGLRPGGGHSCRRKEGGGVWEMDTCDRPVQRGQSKSSNDDSPRAPRRFFLLKNFRYDTPPPSARQGSSSRLARRGAGGWEMDLSDPPWAQANFPPP